MPELPEVESVCRLMRRVLGGKRIVKAEVPPDEIMLYGVDPNVIRSAIEGRTLIDVGRKGKYWWLKFDEPPYLFGHLGMSGWIRQLGEPTRRLHSHGEAPLDDDAGRPRFLKLLMEAEDGSRIAFTDGRRLGRMWLSEGPETDKYIAKLGFDCYNELPDVDALFALLKKRKAPMKAVLLDQSVFAGVGNYLADEALFQSGIAPKRLGASLTREEVVALRGALESILAHAVEVDADYEKFPPEWLFHHRWGGSKGAGLVMGKSIVREQVGGRTTAWVPEIQK